MINHPQLNDREQILNFLTVSYLLELPITSAASKRSLGEDEEWLDEISIQLDPEDGRLRVLGLGDEATTAFSPFGVENLAEFVQIHKADPDLLCWDRLDDVSPA